MGTVCWRSSPAASSGSSAATLFRLPFDNLLAGGLPPLVLDGEIAVPNEKGVTHIDGLSEALRLRRSERLAYFTFDRASRKKLSPQRQCAMINVVRSMT